MKICKWFFLQFLVLSLYCLCYHLYWILFCFNPFMSVCHSFCMMIPVDVETQILWEMFLGKAFVPVELLVLIKDATIANMFCLVTLIIILKIGKRLCDTQWSVHIAFPLSRRKCYIGQTGWCINERTWEHTAPVKTIAAGHSSAHYHACKCRPVHSNISVLA